jgi:hypothetical protein
VNVKVVKCVIEGDLFVCLKFEMWILANFYQIWLDFILIVSEQTLIPLAVHCRFGSQKGFCRILGSGYSLSIQCDIVNKQVSLISQ